MARTPKTRRGLAGWLRRHGYEVLRNDERFEAYNRKKCEHICAEDTDGMIVLHLQDKNNEYLSLAHNEQEFIGIVMDFAG